MKCVAIPKLFACASDVSTQKIFVAAQAAGVDMELKAPLKNGAPPELHKGDRVIRHTNAILRYVGRVFESGDMSGSNFMEAAQVDSWLDWAELELGTANRPNLDQAIGTLEKHLENRVFIVGQRFTLADASVSCSLFNLQKEGKSLPRGTARWLGTCAATPAFQAVLGGASAPVPASGPAGFPSGKVVVAPAEEKPTEQNIIETYSTAVSGRTRIGRILLSSDGGVQMVGFKITLCGWVKTMRSAQKGSISFLQLNDGSCPQTIQVVAEQGSKGFETLKEGCGTGASVRCVGELVASQGQGQFVELAVKAGVDGHEVQVLGTVESKEYPLAKKQHGLEFLREIAHLRPRSNLIGAVARVRSALAFATHEFFRHRGFQYVHTPLITAADCEGAGEMFQVTTLLADAEKKGLPKTKEGKIDYSQDFFGKPSFLTVSGQLSVENYCCALSNVYTFGPTFRAEDSHTSRHLSEFWMIEPELAFADIWDDMQCAEDYLKYCVKFALDNQRADLDFFEAQVEKGLIKRLEDLIKEPFARRSYTDAIEILIRESPKADFQVPVEWGMDLNSEHERYLVEKVEMKPTVVYDYPKDIKAFYMRLNDDGKTCAAMDVLVPQIGEVIGGSQREERLDVLDRRLREMNLEPKDYWWYRDLRRYGSVPHSGFGLGFERLLMLTTGVQNIRDVIPYPRYPGHAEF